MDDKNKNIAKSFSIQSISAMQDNMMRSLMGLSRTIEEVNTKSFEGIAQSISGMQDNMARSLMGLSRTIEEVNTKSFEGIAQSISRMQDNMARSLMGLSRTIEEVNTKSFEGIAQSLGGMQDKVTRSLMEQISNLHEKTLLELDDVDFHIEADGTIVTSENRFNTANIQQEIDSYLENSGFLAKEIEIEKRIATFVGGLAKQHPVIKFVVLYFLIAILVNIYSSHLTASPTNSYQITYNKNVYIKAIQNQPKRMGMQVDSIKRFRFVYADCLLVRDGSSKKARVIDKIYCGQVVEVVNKKKNWTLIKWEDKDNNTRKGWVFTRYLKKFK